MSEQTANAAVNESVSGVQESTAKFDRDELVRGWHAYEARLPAVVPILKFAAKTDMGQVRENNEDKFDFYEPEDPSILAARGCLYAVSDGIGGAQAGQIASELLLKNLISGYYDHSSSDLVQALYESVVSANDRIHSLAQMIPERNGMGATLTALVFCEERVILAQVGDSRAYCLRNGQLFQISQDHSWVEEQVRAGAMSRDEAENSPFRNVITRSVGAAATVHPDFYEEQAQPGDIWLLCSDGLTAYVKDEEMTQILANNSPSEAARQFIELANARGGRDNITVFVIAVREVRGQAAGEANANRNETGDSSNGSVPLKNAPPEEPPPFATYETAKAPAQQDSSRRGWRRMFGLGS
jgi:serine/threonine protein phosphatase PrpC